MFTRKPDKETWDKYEEAKDKFMQDLYDRLESEQLKKDKRIGKEMNNAQPKLRDLTKRELEVQALYNKKIYNQEQIGEQLDITGQRVGQILINISKKAGLSKEKEQIKVSNLNNPPIN